MYTLVIAYKTFNTVYKKLMHVIMVSKSKLRVVGRNVSLKNRLVSAR